MRDMKRTRMQKNIGEIYGKGGSLKDLKHDKEKGFVRCDADLRGASADGTAIAGGGFGAANRNSGGNKRGSGGAKECGGGGGATSGGGTTGGDEGARGGGGAAGGGDTAVREQVGVYSEFDPAHANAIRQPTRLVLDARDVMLFGHRGVTGGAHVASRALLEHRGDGDDGTLDGDDLVYLCFGRGIYVKTGSQTLLFGVLWISALFPRHSRTLGKSSKVVSSLTRGDLKIYRNDTAVLPSERRSRRESGRRRSGSVCAPA